MAGVQGDQGRRILAAWAAPARSEFDDTFTLNAAYYDAAQLGASMGYGQSNYTDLMRRMLDTSRVVPTGSAFAPRRWGALACAYLGQPAS